MNEKKSVHATLYNSLLTISNTKMVACLGKANFGNPFTQTVYIMKNNLHRKRKGHFDYVRMTV